MGEHLGQEPPESRPDVGVCQPVGGRLGDPDRLGVLDDDVVYVHVVGPFECSEVRFDSAQALLLVADGLFDLRPAHPQHPSELFDRRVPRRGPR